MGRAILRVTPEVLASFIIGLPSTTKIVGSAADDQYVSLWLESDLIDSERGELTGTVKVDGLSRTITLEQRG